MNIGLSKIVDVLKLRQTLASLQFLRELVKPTP